MTEKPPNPQEKEPPCIDWKAARQNFLNYPVPEERVRACLAVADEIVKERGGKSESVLAQELCETFISRGLLPQTWFDNTDRVYISIGTTKTSLGAEVLYSADTPSNTPQDVDGAVAVALSANQITSAEVLAKEALQVLKRLGIRDPQKNVFATFRGTAATLLRQDSQPRGRPYTPQRINSLTDFLPGIIKVYGSQNLGSLSSLSRVIQANNDRKRMFAPRSELALLNDNNSNTTALVKDGRIPSCYWANQDSWQKEQVRGWRYWDFAQKQKMPLGKIVRSTDLPLDALASLLDPIVRAWDGLHYARYEDLGNPWTPLIKMWELGIALRDVTPDLSLFLLPPVPGPAPESRGMPIVNKT
jgi:hypothetical protein